MCPEFSVFYEYMGWIKNRLGVSVSLVSTEPIVSGFIFRTKCHAFAMRTDSLYIIKVKVDYSNIVMWNFQVYEVAYKWDNLLVIFPNCYISYINNNNNHHHEL